MTFKERIIAFLAHKKLSQGKFETAVGLSNGTINNLGEGMTSQSILKILKVYPELNTHWLLTGEGEMLLSNKSKSNSEITTEIEIITVDTRGNEVIPITNLQAAAGTGIINSQDFETFDNIQLPERLIKSGQHLCVRIKGESMKPTLQDGGYMIIRRLEPSEWERAKEEHIYSISYRDSDSGEVKTVLKRIKNRLKKSNIIVCMSDNPDKVTFSNFNIAGEEIISLWHAEWYLSARMPNIHDEYYKRLQRLEDTVEELIRKIK